MAYSLTWLPKVLHDFGLNVSFVPGWENRGHGDVGKTLGVLCHHTAGSLKGNAPSLGIVTNGRSDLPGPLAQLHLARDGTFTVVAAGLAYHAGPGKWQGVVTGNKSFVGVEAENTGLANDNPWPAVQMAAYAKGCAAICLHIGVKPIMVAGHCEYALPVGRKPDPAFSVGTRAERIAAMNQFRATVAAIMAEHAVVA
jgi:hypothetical protein